MTFENQNARSKIRVELSEGILIEVPLAVVVRSIQERHMLAWEGDADAGPREAKDFVHWGFPDFFRDEPGKLVHVVVTTHPLERDFDGINVVGGALIGALRRGEAARSSKARYVYRDETASADGWQVRTYEGESIATCATEEQARLVTAALDAYKGPTP